jgi:hypothetical protein
VVEAGWSWNILIRRYNEADNSVSFFVFGGELQGKAQAEVVKLLARHIVVPIRRAADSGIATPAATTVHAASPRLCTLRICN